LAGTSRTTGSLRGAAVVVERVTPVSARGGAVVLEDALAGVRGGGDETTVGSGAPVVVEPDARAPAPPDTTVAGAVGVAVVVGQRAP
jgi:hypothetical protein